MSELFAVQLTAVATLALAVLALAAAGLAGLAFWRQSQEVRLLLEQNKRDTDERRRAQAAHVFLAAPRDEVHLVSPYAHNGSDFPVYDAKIRYVMTKGLSEPENLGTIMPSDTASATRQFPASEALDYAVLTFWDASSTQWMRLPQGGLVEVTSSMQDNMRFESEPES